MGYQLTALVTKLPPRIKDFLASNEDPAVLRFFTERRLRPLTMIPDGEAQMAQFAQLLAAAKDGTTDADEILGQWESASGAAAMAGIERR